MIIRKWLSLIGLSLLLGNSLAQAQTITTIEVESQGTITFSPDSFVVKIFLDYSSINISDRLSEERFSEEIVDVPVETYMSEMDFNTVVEDASPPVIEEEKSPEQSRLERERYRRMEDSLQSIKEKRLLEFMTKIKSLGVLFPKTDSEQSGYRFRSNSWVQNFTSTQYREIDSLSRQYGRPLSMEMIDIKMKNHDILKEGAYRQAIENSKKEAEILAKAMGRKVGKMANVKTEAIDVMDLLPMMLRKEIQREVRKSDRFMQPTLYQLNQELGTDLFDKDRYDNKQTIFWTWTEKIHVTYLLN